MYLGSYNLIHPVIVSASQVDTFLSFSYDFIHHSGNFISPKRAIQLHNLPQPHKENSIQSNSQTLICHRQLISVWDTSNGLTGIFFGQNRTT